ncbi:MAG TPA: FecR family protein [Anaeromyxobacter sp.]|nr:FecR family protein [Anaeromyxobacter sp.]
MSRNRSPLAIAAALAAIALAIGTIALLRTRARFTAAAAAQIETARASVLDVRGAVEHSDETGAWAAVSRGVVLGPRHSLRTGAGASAELAMGNGATLTITENTHCTVSELTTALHRVRLARGRIVVDYDLDGSRSVRVEAGDASAESRGGTFGVLRAGDAVSVATQSGEVELRSSGAAVAVGPGEHAIAWPRQAPTRPRPLSRELLLRAAQVLESSRDRACGRLVGRVEPGSEVSVDGKTVDVDAEGRFAVLPAPKAPGRRVTVVTRDAAGRTARRVVECEGDARLTGFDVRWE